MKLEQIKSCNELAEYLLFNCMGEQDLPKLKHLKLKEGYTFCDFARAFREAKEMAAGKKLTRQSIIIALHLREIFMAVEPATTS